MLFARLGQPGQSATQREKQQANQTARYCKVLFSWWYHSYCVTR